MASLAPLRSLPRALAIAAGRSAPTGGAIVLAYHDVREQASGYHVTADDLRQHLDLVHSSGAEIVALGDIVRRLREGAAVDGLAAITFDDAIVGVRDLGLPVLRAAGVPATVFAIAERLGHVPDWTTGEQRTLSPEELRALGAEPGIDIGCHGATHTSLPSCAGAALDRELSTARTTLEQAVGRTVDLLAYPYGHHDATVRSTAAAAGFVAGLTFLNGRITPGLDPFRLPRLTMGEHHGRLRLAEHLARSADAWPDTQLETVDGAARA